MGRKAKTERVPRTRAGGEWTEAAIAVDAVLWYENRKPMLSHRLP